MTGEGGGDTVLLLLKSPLCFVGVTGGGRYGKGVSKAGGGVGRVGVDSMLVCCSCPALCPVGTESQPRPLQPCERGMQNGCLCLQRAATDRGLRACAPTFLCNLSHTLERPAPHASPPTCPGVRAPGLSGEASSTVGTSGQIPLPVAPPSPTRPPRRPLHHSRAPAAAARAPSSSLPRCPAAAAPPRAGPRPPRVKRYSRPRTSAGLNQ